MHEIDPSLLDDPKKFATFTVSERGKEIMKIAARFFHERGFLSVSLQDIADEVGMLKGSLYYHIGSKDDLLYAIVYELHVKSIERLQELKQLKGNPAEILRELIVRHILRATSIIEESSVFYANFDKLSPQKQASLITQSDAYEAFITKLVQKGKADSLFNRDMNTRLVVNGMLGIMNSIYRWYKTTGKITPDELAQTYADMIVNGIRVS